MKKIIDELINHSIKGVDVYRHKDATWLIFSEQNRWVVELTDNGTLWYNYNFFNNILKYVSLEFGRESNDYITGWANDYFFKDIKKVGMGIPGELAVDIVINYGVKNIGMGVPGERAADIVINDGVKNVRMADEEENKSKVIFVINEGVKEVKVVPLPDMSGELRGYSDYYNTKEDRTKPHTEYIKEAIEGGVKNTWPDMIPNDYDWSDEFDANKVIGCGVKV